MKIWGKQSGRSARLVVSVLVLLLTLTSCTSPTPEATGPELFSQLCSACHGARLEGKTGPPLGQGSPSAALPDEYLVTSIRRGIGKMPSFDHLMEEQVSRLISYIRDVQGGG